MDRLESLKTEMSEKSLVVTEEQHDWGYEAKFFASDHDCQSAGQPLTEFDLFISTLIHPDETVPGLSDILDEERHRNLAQHEEPFCSGQVTSVHMKRLDNLMVIAHNTTNQIEDIIFQLNSNVTKINLVKTPFSADSERQKNYFMIL